ncbi:hypothetical protein SISSUDRAFT_1057719 [Sistotremastrum suecicum HHB10207 ss-3]|uniref:PIG-F-domain-containing protein n=1 Tax=Sistotremastrum suecicum HHB10207 ss-3 TaxID=1314776 RepID=A0A166I1Y7_9AGAM|nr:hypothetical protein SISSUDRAFT_1057719 [Sistotremastrum suecicum HHB10207 ss-3]
MSFNRKKNRHPTAQKTSSTSKPTSGALEPTGLPLLQYSSLLGTCTLLMGFNILFLPRTSLVISPLTSLLPPPSSSLDKPQHPFLDPLTANPILTTAWWTIGAVIICGWWAGWMKHWYKFSRAIKDDVSLTPEIKLKAHTDAWLSTIAVSVALYVLLILFGAPIASHHAQTYLLALLVALLTVLAPLYALGRPSFDSDPDSMIRRLTWFRLFAELSPRNHWERAAVYPAVGSVLGCWVSAIPIALDWDRPWQAWPLTCAVGAMTGFMSGGLASLATNVVVSLANEEMGQTAAPPVEKKRS